jgi:hypothetical protein
MSTAFIKRLLQFIRQCDRLNYPNRMRHQREYMQHQQLLLQQQVQRDFLDSLRQSGSVDNNSPATNAQQGFAGYPMPQSTNVQTAKKVNSIKPSKQRKQKGTLVMRSSHNQVPTPQPTSHLPSTALNHQFSRQNIFGNVHSGGLNSNSLLMMDNQHANAPSAYSIAIQKQHHQLVVTPEETGHHKQFPVPPNRNVWYDHRSMSMPSSLLSSPLYGSQSLLKQHHQERQAYFQGLFQQQQQQYQQQGQQHQQQQQHPLQRHNHQQQQHQQQQAQVQAQEQQQQHQHQLQRQLVTL